MTTASTTAAAPAPMAMRRLRPILTMAAPCAGCRIRCVYYPIDMRLRDADTPKVSIFVAFGCPRGTHGADKCRQADTPTK
ncbi:hypothetical protein GCM10023223_24590 [Stackebrandtia albiflava]